MAFDLTGTATFTAGKYGQGVTAATLSAYMTSVLSPLDGTTNWTVELWSKNAPPAALQIMAGVPYGFWIGMLPTGFAEAHIGGGNSTPEQIITSLAAITDGLYHHYALVMTDTTGARLFVDGIFQGQTGAFPPGPVVALYQEFEVGYFTNAYNWGGQLDEVAVSNVAKYTANFTPAAIASAQPGLVALYRFEGDTLNSAGVVAPTAPTPPTGVTATGATGQNNIAWTASAGATSYNVARSTTPTGTFTLLGSTPGTSYADATSVANTAYYYTITATNATGTSAASAAAGPATSTGTAISAPTNVTATSGTGQNVVSWTATAGGTGYNVLRSLTATGTFTQIGTTTTATSYADATATVGTAYYYQVQGVTASGTSASSATAGPATPTAVAAGLSYPADHAALRYSPYNWLVSGGVAKTINSGAYFTTLFSGQTCSLAFDLTGIATPLPQVAISIDGGRWQRQEIAATIVCTVPAPADANTVPPLHLLRVVVAATTETADRWNTQATAVKFRGLILAASATLTATAGSTLNVLLFGDSITEGVRALGDTAASRKDTDRNDVTGAWSMATAEHLGASFGVVGFGASGLTVGGSGGVPALTSAYNLLWAGQPRSFAPVPDLVILNEGTNDAAGTAYQTALTTTLNNLLALGAGLKVLLLNPFNGTHAADFAPAIAACNAPTRVTYRASAEIAPGTSDGTHPFAWWATGIAAPAIANTARALLLGTTTAPAIPTGSLPVGLSLFKFVGPSAVSINTPPFATLGIIWTVPDAGSWVSGKPAGPSFQAVTQFVPGNKYYVLNSGTAPISLYGAQL